MNCAGQCNLFNQNGWSYDMRVLVLGGNSDIGLAVARRFARHQKAQISLGARDIELASKKANDIAVRFQVDGDALYFDALDFTSHQDFYDALDPKPDVVILSFGYLGDQFSAQTDFEEISKIIQTNYLGAVSILECVAKNFEARGHGVVIGISSVAGLRGRKSNYFYGSAKAGFTIYLQGLRHRLFSSQGRVIIAMPGFARTKMTQGLDLPKMLTAEPDEVAKDIYRAYAQNKDTVFSKWFWKWIMKIICLIPEKLFVRTNL